MRNKVITLIILISCIGVIKAQDSTRLVLSLEQAERYAVEHNRTLQNANYEVQKAQRSRWQALASMLPQVNANFDYQNFCGYSMNFMQGVSIPMNPSGTLGVTASMALSGAQIINTLMADISIDMQNISQKQSEQSIIANVDKLYFSTLAMEGTVDLLTESLNNLKRLQEMTDWAVKAGVTEQTESDKIAVQVATMQSSINSANRSIEMLYNSLRLQLCTDVNCEIILSDNIDHLLSIGEIQDLLNKDFILENNYSYQLLEKNLELSKKQITLSKMNCLPTISAYYQYSAKTYFGKEEGMNMTPPNMVGASLSVPLWSSLAKKSAVEQSKLNYKTTENTFNDTKNSLLVQDRQLRYNLTSAYETYLIQQDNVDVTKRVFDNISEKFEYGRASSLEVTNASTDIITAQNNYLKALIELVEAHVELRTLLNISK